MPQPKHTGRRREPAFSGRITRALAQASLEKLAIEAALRTLELSGDDLEAKLAHRLDPTSAASRFLTALAKRDSSSLRASYFFRTDPAAWFGEPFDQGQPFEASPSERTSLVDVDPVWKALGSQLGFLPVLSDLAVIVHDSYRHESYNDLVQHVAELTIRLDEEGREHSAIALVTTGLPDDVESAIFEAGAQLLIVEPAFMDLNNTERVAKLQTLLDDSSDVQLPVVVPERGADSGLYDKPNPSLTADELADWVRRFEQSDESD